MPTRAIRRQSVSLLQPLFQASTPVCARPLALATRIPDLESAPRTSTTTDQRKFGKAFLHHYLYPMGAAIWSSPIQELRAFGTTVPHFLENRILLRPSTVHNGSTSRRLTHLRASNAQGFPPHHSSSAPKTIQRRDNGVCLHCRMAGTGLRPCRHWCCR